ncbi:hypothetical protein DPMN_129071 [Dreissena polymorpha]|uniref:Uncharacterized protein n=1 Tax=Dreissena polymorpha TaxID=45954 RepID=A0A9D4H2G0_DREPO|nr:hypothetical protein DPMN_129071 [Dreissena polymorpha]
MKYRRSSRFSRCMYGLSRPHSCRPEPQNGFLSTLSVLSTAVLQNFHYLHRATPSKSWPVSLPKVRHALPLR